MIPARRAPAAPPLPVAARLLSALAAVGGGAALLALGAVLRHWSAGHLVLVLPGVGAAALGSTVAPFTAGAWLGAALARAFANGGAAARPTSVALAAAAGAAGASLAVSLGIGPTFYSRGLEAAAALLAATVLALVGAGFSAPPLDGPRRFLPLLLPVIATTATLGAAVSSPIRLPAEQPPAARHAWALAKLGEPYRLATEQLAGDGDLRDALGEPLLLAPAGSGPKRIVQGAGGWSVTLAIEVHGPRGATECEISGLRPLVGDRTPRWQEPLCAEVAATVDPTSAPPAQRTQLPPASAN